MKDNFKNILVHIICMLYIILFTYAAVSKFRVFDEFKIQLGQSPVLTAYAEWVAWIVPSIEIILAVILIFPRFRKFALYACYTLMVMFTVYIVIILNFSDFIPCSCGGVLEKLGWTEHLIFNIAFVVMAFIGVMLLTPEKNKEMVDIEAKS